MLKPNTIEWHEDCLKNMKKNYERTHEEIEYMLKRTEQMGSKILFLQYQIDEAEKMGKEKFDRDRFRVKRNK